MAVARRLIAEAMAEQDVERIEDVAAPANAGTPPWLVEDADALG
jgi:hypothetical protein